MVCALSRACLNACVVARSGLAAPLRTATPMPERAMPARVLSLPDLMRSSVASTPRMATSNARPFSIMAFNGPVEPYSALSLWPVAFSNPGASSSITDFNALEQSSVISAAFALPVASMTAIPATTAASPHRFMVRIMIFPGLPTGSAFIGGSVGKSVAGRSRQLDPSLNGSSTVLPFSSLGSVLCIATQDEAFRAQTPDHCGKRRGLRADGRRLLEMRLLVGRVVEPSGQVLQGRLPELTSGGKTALPAFNPLFPAAAPGWARRPGYPHRAGAGDSPRVREASFRAPPLRATC